MKFSTLDLEMAGDQTHLYVCPTRLLQVLVVRSIQHVQTAAAHMRGALDGLLGEHYRLYRVRRDRHAGDRAGVQGLRQPVPQRLHFHMVALGITLLFVLAHVRPHSTLDTPRFAAHCFVVV